MKTDEQHSRLSDDPWNFFASVKLTVTVLILLAATSVIGTLIPQIDFQWKDDYSLSFNRRQTPGAPPGGDPFTGDVTYYNPPWNQQESHIMWNASIAYNHPSNKWSLRAYVKNIDNYAAKNAYGGHFDIKLGLSDPRLYGLVLNINLGGE